MEVCSFFNSSLLPRDLKVVDNAACDPVGKDCNYKQLEKSRTPRILNSASPLLRRESIA